jgi:hypothetical protein
MQLSSCRINLVLIRLWCSNYFIFFEKIINSLGMGVALDGKGDRGIPKRQWFEGNFRKNKV